jgi:phosphomannomutase
MDGSLRSLPSKDMTQQLLTCFKAYDIRGRIPDELNEDILYRIGRAYTEFLKPQTVVVGYDARPDSLTFATILSRALNEGGADVVNIGLCGTEEVYFHTFHRGCAGGIMVTASHNPMDYNGLKLVREHSKPISGDSGLLEIKRLAEVGHFSSVSTTGSTRHEPDKSAYIDGLLGYVDRRALRPLKIVVNAGNGCAGPIIDALEPHLPFHFIKIHHQPDPSFPNGIPNPLLPENRVATVEAIQAHGADLGLAWDGDFDRCFFFDGTGRFIEGYYLVGLLATQLLASHPGAKIIHDPRLTWNTIEQVTQAGGIAVQSKTGHAFIKERMRQEDALYGGEMSAHHYFRDFAYCDSGMIPWLLITELMSRSGKSLASWVDERIGAYPCSGELNYRVADVQETLAQVLRHFSNQAQNVDQTDGISVEFEDWRFNLRGSNTEPLLRLNVEARGNMGLINEGVRRIEQLIVEASAL